MCKEVATATNLALDDNHPAPDIYGILFMSKFKSIFYFKYYNLIESKINKFKISRKIKNIKVNKNFSYSIYLKDLNIPKESTIFIHAGLRSIKKSSGDEYNIIISKIINEINNIYSPSAIIAPAFTPSFRLSGIYSKKHSKAEYGAFSELFRKIATYRTNDAIHSCSIISDNYTEFTKYDYDDTFGENGIYKSLINNTYIINISTNHFVATYLHYIESYMKCPYKNHNAFWNGFLLNESNESIEKIQYNHAYLYECEINRKKLIKTLINKKGIVIKKYNQLMVSSISVEKLDSIVKSEVKNDPYYLVSF